MMQMYQKFIVNVVYMTCAQYSISSDVILFFWVEQQTTKFAIIH